MYLFVICNIDYFLSFHFNWPINYYLIGHSGLNRRHLDGYLDNLLHNLFNYLWNQYYLFNNSGNYDYFLDNLFNLNTFWYFYNLLYNLFFGCGHLFDLFIVQILGNYFLFFNHDWHFLFHDKWHIFDNLNRNLLFQNNMLDYFNRNVLNWLDCLDERHLMNLFLDLNLRDYHWHLYKFLDFSNLYLCLIDDLWNFNLNNLEILLYS